METLMQIQKLSQAGEFALLVLGALIFVFTILNISLVFLVIGIFKELKKAYE